MSSPIDRGPIVVGKMYVWEDGVGRWLNDDEMRARLRVDRHRLRELRRADLTYRRKSRGHRKAKKWRAPKPKEAATWVAVFRSNSEPKWRLAR